MDILLDVKNFSVKYMKHDRLKTAVDDINLTVRRGEALALVGESGSGKTSLLLGITRLLGKNAKISGQALFKGRDILTLKKTELSKIRGREISCIFQESSNTLDPLMKVGRQVSEIIANRFDLNPAEAKRRTLEILDSVGFEHPEHIYTHYPFELSGGMQQRIAIAVSLSAEPSLLIADEPTSALDVSAQQQIVRVLQAARKEKPRAVIIITHDLGVAAELADRVAVMKDGRIIETAPAETLFSSPQAEYTKSLVANYT